MNKVKIICDSTCDLPKELLEELDVEMSPLQINFGVSESYYDNELTVDELYKKVEEKKILPKTSAKTPGEYHELFKKWTDQGYDVLYTGIGGAISSSHRNGVMMAEEFDGHVEVFDSQNLSTGIGLLILKACKFRDQGDDVHEIVRKLNEIAPRVRSQFAIKTMEFLYKGGRCSGVAKLLGTILKIKPVIAVRDGVMSVYGKPRGKMVIALDFLLDMLKEAGNNVDPDCIFVTHSKADEEAEYLLPKVKEMHPEAKVMETKAGCIISTHCGPGTIGILWINKE